MELDGTRVSIVREARWVRWLMVIVGLACIAVCSWVMDRLSLSVGPFTYISSFGFYANTLPYLILFGLLLSLTARFFLATSSTLIIAAIVAFANYEKLEVLSRPLSFSDLFFVKEIDLSVLRLLSSYINPWVAVGCVAVFIVAAILVFKHERPFFRKRSSMRICLAIISMAMAVLVVSGSSWLSTVYDAGKIRFVGWAPALTVLHTGIAATIIYQNIDYAHALSEAPDTTAIDKFLALATPKAAMPAVPATPKVTRPDIVVIQSESLFDPEILADISDSDAVLPNLHSAIASGKGGRMLVPTFGGGTIRTEFEVLTSIPMAAYPRISFPYLQIRQDHIPSLPFVLRKSGYEAYAIHGNEGSFWNRTKTFVALGFQHFVTAKDFPAGASKDGRYMSDHAMTNMIESVLDHASAPTFIFAISIEAHGPYGNSALPANPAARDAMPAPKAWPQAARDEYKNYTYHIHDADSELGRLIKYLDARGRPYILAFYGDHLPGLVHVYHASAFDDGRLAPLQQVPWLLASGPKSGVVQSRSKIYAWMLGANLLEAAGVELPQYYRSIRKAELIMGTDSWNTQSDSVLAGIDSLARSHLVQQPQSAASVSTEKEGAK